MSPMTTREVAATLRRASDLAASVAARLRSRGAEDPEFTLLGVNVDVIASSLAMYADTADAIATKAGEPAHAEVEPVGRCIYGCSDPLSCNYPHERCDHCRQVRTAASAPPMLADLIGSGVRGVFPLDVDNEADAAVQGSGS